MKNKLLIVGVVIAILLSFTALMKDSSNVTNNVTKYLPGEKNTGALAGPDIPFNYVSWGGVSHYAQEMALNTATTTPCALQSPSATSTLTRWSFMVTTATSTAVTLHMATSTTAFATSTLVQTRPIASGAQISWSLMPTTTEASVVAPNTWLVVGAQGFTPSGADTTKFLGSCSADWTVMQ